MKLAFGARVGAGVLGILGGALALLIGFVLLLFGGALGALTIDGGWSAAGTGALVMVLGCVAVGGAALFFIPKSFPAVILMALDIAAILWAFSRIDWTAVALIPVLPLGFAVLLGLAGGSRHEPG
jgi:hypothetical protein